MEIFGIKWKHDQKFTGVLFSKTVERECMYFTQSFKPQFSQNSLCIIYSTWRSEAELGYSRLLGNNGWMWKLVQHIWTLLGLILQCGNWKSLIKY